MAFPGAKTTLYESGMDVRLRVGQRRSNFL
jgi:hypothetical protein